MSDSKSRGASDAQELRQLWNRSTARSSHMAEPTTQPEEILMHVRERSDKFDRALHWRDLREAAAGVLVIFVAFWTSFAAPTAWPKIGAYFLAVCVVIVLAILRRSHRSSRTNDGSLGTRSVVQQVQSEIEKVRRQEELLRRVAIWYIAPLAVGGTVWMLSFLPALPMPPGALAGVGAALFTASLVIFGAVGWAVLALNQRAIERELVPYRHELEQTLSELS